MRFDLIGILCWENVEDLLVCGELTRSCRSVSLGSVWNMSFVLSFIDFFLSCHLLFSSFLPSVVIVDSKEIIQRHSQFC